MKTLEFISNGLVNDIFYYRGISSGRNYTVAIFQVCVKTYPTSDFLTLDGESWLSNFAVDVALYLLETKEFQVIPQEIATIIMSDSGNVSKYLLKKMKIVKNHVIMHLLICQNHHQRVDFEKQKFSFLDPFGSTMAKT